MAQSKFLSGCPPDSKQKYRVYGIFADFGKMPEVPARIITGGFFLHSLYTQSDPLIFPC